MKEFDENKIDAFLLGLMESSESTEFKKKMSMDRDFANQVRQRQEAIRYVDMLGDLAMKERVKNLHKEAVKNLPEKKTFKFTVLLKYAAAIACIIIAGYWFLQGSTSGAEIYDNYYQAYDLNFGDRGAQGDAIASAGRFYTNGEYQKALEQFSLLQTEPLSSKVVLAKGISFLETAQYQKAVTVFQQLVDNKDVIYEDHARWYLAMAYFKDGKDKKAKALIQQIANKTGSFNQEKAIDILKEL